MDLEDIAEIAEQRLIRTPQWRNVLIKALLICAASASLIAAAGISAYHMEKKEITERFVTEAKAHIATQKLMITHELQLIMHSLLFLANQAESHKAMSSSTGFDIVRNDFLTFLETTDHFDQARLIAANGKEVIRVDYNNGKPVLAPAQKLQNKASRYYVRDALTMPPASIYISALDMNMEQGKVEIPLKPTLRIAKAIYDDNGKTIGIVVLNYLAESLLEQFRRSSLLSSGDVMLANQDGLLIADTEREIEWNEGLLHASHIDSQGADHIWQQIRQNDNGIIRYKEDLFVFSTFSPAHELTLLPGINIAKASEAFYWKVTGRFGPEHLDTAMAIFKTSLRGWAILSILVLFALAWPLALLIEKRRLSNDYISMLYKAVDSSHDSILITDTNGIIEYANNGFVILTGYNRDEAIGKNPSEILKSDAQPSEFYKDMWETITTGDIWQGALVDRRKDGSYLPLNVTISPVRDETGAIRHYVAVQQDASKSMMLQEKHIYEEKMKSLGVAVGGIAHEFNNMLTGILGNTFLLQSLDNQNQEIVNKLETIEKLGTRAAEMIQQMLSYTGLELVQHHVFDIIQIANEIYGERKIECPHTVTFIADIDTQPYNIIGSPAHIREAVHHLLSNACDAVENSKKPKVVFGIKRIRIDTELASRLNTKAKQCIRIFVQDNGAGIPPDHQQSIFEPFFTTKTVGKGTGLGLSAVHGIVKSHGGVIKLDSTPGKGSTFNIYLPPAETESSAE